MKKELKNLLSTWLGGKVVGTMRYDKLFVRETEANVLWIGDMESTQGAKMLAWKCKKSSNVFVNLPEYETVIKPLAHKCNLEIYVYNGRWIHKN